MYKWLMALFLVTGCSSAHKVSSGTQFMADENYQERKSLNESFVKMESHNLSDKEIQKLLTSKISQRKAVKLAFINIGHGNKNFSFDHMGRIEKDLKALSVNGKNQDIFLGLTKSAKKVKSIAIVPSFLTPKSLTVANLRDTAALLQAHYLVMIQSNSELDFKFHTFSPNEAISTVNMEVALIDVSTGAIPFTSLVTGRAKIRKNDKEDFNSREFQERALRGAENAAFQSIAKDLTQVFNANVL